MNVITKNSKIFTVSEADTKWTVKTVSGKTEIVIDISKGLFPTEADLYQYIQSSNLF